MAMNHLGKSAKLRSAGLPQNSEQQQKKQTPKWLIWALRLLSLCGGCGAIPSATSPSCRGTCQLLQAPSWHGIPCPRACPASLGRSRVSGDRWAADAPEGEENKDDIVPHASPGNSHHFFSPQLVYGRQLPSFILTLKKNSNNTTAGSEGECPTMTWAQMYAGNAEEGSSPAAQGP